MKKSSLLLLLIIAACSGNKQNNSSTEGTVNVASKTPTLENTQFGSPILPDWIYNAESLKGQEAMTVYQVQITNKKTGIKIQEIGMESESVEFNDYNFDVYKEVAFLVSCANLDNCVYQVYLFDPAQRKLFLDEKLSELVNIEVDTTARLLTSTSRSQGGISYSITKYEMVTGVLGVV